MDKVEDVILSHMLLANPSDYDPVKAHEYYLRTRKLKGRRIGSQVVKTGRNTSHRIPKHTIVQPVNPKVRAITHQMMVLQGALTELRKALKVLIEKEKQAAATHKKKSTASSEDKKKQEDRKPLTATQKKDAAERAKKSYEKNKKPHVQTREEIRAKIKEIETKLVKLKADLKKIRQHSLATPSKIGSASAGRPPGGS